MDDLRCQRHTGELIAREAHRRGLSPVLAGRSPATVDGIAAALGLESRCFALDDSAALARGLDSIGLVLHCAGPHRHPQHRGLHSGLAARDRQRPARQLLALADRLAPGAGLDEALRATLRSYLWGEARNAAGSTRTARIKTGNGYSITISGSLAVVEHRLREPSVAGAYAVAAHGRKPGEALAGFGADAHRVSAGGRWYRARAGFSRDAFR